MSLGKVREMLGAVRLNTLSNLMVLVAAVELVVLIGIELDRYFHSYRVQRDSACILGR